MSKPQWNGEAVKAKAHAAAQLAVDRTMADCVIHAKRNHPGWKNITGAAEGSIRVVQFATIGRGVVRGLWGSTDINYMIWLELKHGSALRSTTDAIYPRLNRYLREAFSR